MSFLLLRYILQFAPQKSVKTQNYNKRFHLIQQNEKPPAMRVASPLINEYVS